MKKLLTISFSAAVGFLLAVLVLEPGSVAVGGGGAPCSSVNGDVNADGRIDLSDAVTVLGNLFLGSPTQLPPLCSQPGGPSGVAATGQTVCYNFDGVNGIWVPIACGESTCAGQDGSYTKGCPVAGRFVDNDDGTLTDTCTGLMWQKDSADVNDDGKVDLVGDALAWCDALNYCETLTFAGHDDWRLPNVRELQSIVDYGRASPSIDPIFGALPEFYWTSTSHTEAPDDAWGLGFNVGYVGVRVKAGDFDFSYNFVRAVRNAQ